MEPEIDDIKNLNKKQLILLTLLITFVVSIATGVITVSIMNQMPKAVPQTINNVIQRTIEKVSTVEVPSSSTDDNAGTLSTNESNSSESSVVMGSSDSLLSIYNENYTLTEGDTKSENEEAVGQGIIISESGLILVDSKIISGNTVYKVVLGGKLFNASRLKDFDNGFTVLQVSKIVESSEGNQDTIETTNQ